MKDGLADKLITDLHIVNRTLSGLNEICRKANLINAHVALTDAIDSIEDAISEVKCEQE